MTDVSAETDLFKTEADGRAAVFFLARRISHDNSTGSAGSGSGLLRILHRWQIEGWRTSVAEMFGSPAEPAVYETGFAHDIDVAGVFEAPSIQHAYSGIDELTAHGWGELFDTSWQVGAREFQPVVGRAGQTGERRPWAFFALWQWNDDWQKASPADRSDYDRECDEAFSFDIESGINIAGRHRLDAQSSWHHLGIWDVPSFAHIARAMEVHERVADFKFTTSRHYVGRHRSLADYLGEFS